MDVETPEPEMVAPSDKPPEALHHRDLAFIQQQRSRLRLFDPAGVYYFRHVAPTWFHSCLHFVSFLFSLTLIVYFSFRYYRLSLVDIVDIGKVSELTLIDYSAGLLAVLAVIFGMKALNKQLIVVPLQRYRLSMLANVFNSVVLNIIQFYILKLLILPVYKKHAALDFSNGVVADSVNAVSWVIIVIIFYTAFRHCHKELAE